MTMPDVDSRRKGITTGEHLALRRSMSTQAVVTDEERAVHGGRRIALRFTVSSERVPAILLLPLEPRPAPAALLLHGYSSHKERMADSAGRTLMRLGVASLAIDLPLHGARVSAGSAAGLPAGEARNPLRLAQRWRMALTEASAALRLLRNLPEVRSDRLTIIGYSVGAYLGLMLAADEASVSALVLAAGGDLPEELPFSTVVRTFVDPIRAVRRYAGRPLLMVNGRNDRTISPAQAERLYAAAGEPKSINWYQGGHWLPDSAVQDAARWVVDAVA